MKKTFLFLFLSSMLVFANPIIKQISDKNNLASILNFIEKNTNTLLGSYIRVKSIIEVKKRDTLENKYKIIFTKNLNLEKEQNIYIKKFIKKLINKSFLIEGEIKNGKIRRGTVLIYKIPQKIFKKKIK